MKHRDRIRRTAILCCHCARNSAYYRAGWTNGVIVVNNDFWHNLNSNFLDLSVLEWCKLFTDRRGQHHWKKVVAEPDYFIGALREKLSLTVDEFEAHSKRIKTYRDKFVAHLDSERIMELPMLNPLIDSVVYLYGNLWNDFNHYLPDGPIDLRAYYKKRLEKGREVYANAT